MNKVYLSIVALSMAFSSAAQRNGELTSKFDYSPATTTAKPKPVQATDRATVLWDDDFSAPGNWVMTNTSTPSIDWTIETNPSNMPNAAPSLYPFASATATNGFALINSDGAPGNADGDGAIIAEITTATSFDLSATPNLILRFSHNYRWWHEERGVRVSGDNGLTWTEFPITSETGGAISTGYPNDQNSGNPEITEIDISGAAGAQTLIQFYYNDNDFWAWYWVVDDVEILEKPDNDVQLVNAWFSGTTNDGIEYGRTPVNHLDASYAVGGEVLNFGVLDQTSIVLDADYGSFTAQATEALIEADSTKFMEDVITPSLAVGVYSGTYTVESNGDQPGGAEFGDNTYPRVFEVTNDMYSMDNIGNNPASTVNLGTIGTASFTGAADGLVIATEYRLKQSDMVSGFRVFLTSASQVGGEIVASVKDTGTFRALDMTSIVESSLHSLTAAEISQGYVDILFDNVQTLPAGAYYAAVDLFSSGNTANVVLVDDRTVPQPGLASAIFIPGDNVFSNGIAVGIRMLMGDTWGVGIAESALTGVKVYPNPSEGVITVTNAANTENTVKVFDMLGKEIFATSTSTDLTIDLTKNMTGVYLVKVSNANGSITERVVIK